MQDPLITLYSALKNNWSLTGDLAPDKVRFSTGWYDDEFEDLQVTITEAYSRDQPFELGYGTVRVYGAYQVDIWVKASRVTGSGPGKAKDSKWKMRDEVKKIFKANLTGLTDLEYVVLDQVGRDLDELDRAPPLLRYSLLVSVIYDI